MPNMPPIKLLKFIISIPLLLGLFSCPKSEPPQSGAPVTPAVAVSDTFWIDVRTPGEFAGGHLTGATNIPLQILDQEFQARVPQKDAVIALYCRSGNRSGKALAMVQSWGYSKAYNAGGFAALSQARTKP